MNQNGDFDFEAYVVREVGRGPVVVMRPPNPYSSVPYYIIYSEGDKIGDLRASQMTNDRYEAIRTMGARALSVTPSNEQFRKQNRVVLYPNYGEWKHGNYALLRFMQDAISENTENLTQRMITPKTVKVGDKFKLGPWVWEVRAMGVGLNSNTEGGIQAHRFESDGKVAELYLTTDLFDQLDWIEPRIQLASRQTEEIKRQFNREFCAMNARNEGILPRDLFFKWLDSVTLKI